MKNEKKDKTYGRTYWKVPNFAVLTPDNYSGI